MYSAQVQLGTLYLGLFGSTAFLLYLQISALKSIPRTPRSELYLLPPFVLSFLGIDTRDTSTATSSWSLVRTAAAGIPSGAGVLRTFQRFSMCA
jgi:hypothetical protein